MLDIDELDGRHIAIFGQLYTIKLIEEQEEKGVAGSTYFYDKLIKIVKPNEITPKGNQRNIMLTLRHEIIHASLFENGLEYGTIKSQEGWAVNEEMVDWFAHQWNTINKIFEELGINEN